MRDRTPIQSIAALLGVVFLIVGVAGFIPGITTHYGDMKFLGHDSGAKLLGIFQISILENIVHLLYGVGGLAFAKTWEGARTYLIGGGAIYLVLWIYGWIVDNNSSANFVPANYAGNFLHAILGITMVALGLALSRNVATADRDRAAVV